MGCFFIRHILPKGMPGLPPLRYPVASVAGGNLLNAARRCTNTARSNQLALAAENHSRE